MFSDSIGTRSSILPTALAIIAGAANWQYTNEIAQGRAPWEVPLYWQVSYPTLLLAAFLLGMAWRERPWRWAVLLMASQAIWASASAVILDATPNLFPLGPVMFTLLAVPCLLAAYAGRWAGEQAIA